MSRRALVARYAMVSLLMGLLPISACGPNSDGSKFREVERLWASVPMYPSMIAVVERKMSSGRTAGLSRYFRSEAKYDEVKQYYLSEMPRNGWVFCNERSLKSWGQDLGEKEIKFLREGAPDYHVIVSFMGDSITPGLRAYCVGIGWR